MNGHAAARPLTAALDPAARYSLVSLALGDLPVDIISTPALRRLKLVKTLGGEHGLKTEVQQFQESDVCGIRTIAAAIQEFKVSEREEAVLRGLERTAALDIASRRLALLRVLAGDAENSSGLDDAPALSFDEATKRATESLTRRYTRALFASIFTDSRDGIQSIGGLVTWLDRISASGDPAERRRAHAHIRAIQQRFHLNDIREILPFFSDFDHLVTAIAHYRRDFLGLAPHLKRFDHELRDLSRTEDKLHATMLAGVARHLDRTVTSLNRLFEAFDASLDPIIATANPQTFRQLQTKLQRTYAAAGTLLCAWGLRLQVMHARTQVKRRDLSLVARIDIIRDVVCKHLDDRDPAFTDLQQAVAFLASAAQRADDSVIAVAAAG